MERKTLGSFIAISLMAACLLTGLPASAQNNNQPPASSPSKEGQKGSEEVNFPLNNGRNDEEISPVRKCPSMSI